MLHDSFYHIIQYLDLPHLLKLSAVNRELNEIADTPLCRQYKTVGNNLIFACRSGYLELVQWLISQRFMSKTPVIPPDTIARMLGGRFYTSLGNAIAPSYAHLMKHSNTLIENAIISKSLPLIKYILPLMGAKFDKYKLMLMAHTTGVPEIMDYIFGYANITTETAIISVMSQAIWERYFDFYDELQKRYNDLHVYRLEDDIVEMIRSEEYDIVDDILKRYTVDIPSIAIDLMWSAIDHGNLDTFISCVEDYGCVPTINNSEIFYLAYKAQERDIVKWLAKNYNMGVEILKYHIEQDLAEMLGN